MCITVKFMNSYDPWIGVLLCSCCLSLPDPVWTGCTGKIILLCQDTGSVVIKFDWLIKSPVVVDIIMKSSHGGWMQDGRRLDEGWMWVGCVNRHQLAVKLCETLCFWFCITASRRVFPENNGASGKAGLSHSTQQKEGMKGREKKKRERDQRSIKSNSSSVASHLLWPGHLWNLRPQVTFPVLVPASQSPGNGLSPSADRSC